MELFGFSHISEIAVAGWCPFLHNTVEFKHEQITILIRFLNNVAMWLQKLFQLFFTYWEVVAGGFKTINILLKEMAHYFLCSSTCHNVKICQFDGEKVEAIVQECFQFCQLISAIEINNDFHRGTFMLGWKSWYNVLSLQNFCRLYGFMI